MEKLVEPEIFAMKFELIFNRNYVMSFYMLGRASTFKFFSFILFMKNISMFSSDTEIIFRI